MHLRRTPEVLLALTAAVALLIPAGCAKKRDSVTNPRSGPAADFSATPVSGDRPLDVDFTDQSIAGTSTITSFLWSFGDGGQSTEHNTGHLYASPGTYTVSLTVTTAEGSDTKTKANLITVSNGPGTSPPNAAFMATPTGGVAPLDVSFTDQSSPGSSTISSWSWKFGDGGGSPDRNPTHRYLANGTYTCSLTVTTSVGSDTEAKPGYITVSQAPVPPTAEFSGSPLGGRAPLTVQFTDQSATGSAGITQWTWTFGDGATSTLRNPSHTYAAEGSYPVSLTVTTTVGTDSKTKPGYITVTGAAVPPTAEFSGTPTSGAAPLAVNFTDRSTPGTSPITSRSWTFGDGGTSTSTNPSHNYAAPGNYDVSLTVTTADGQNTQSKPAYIKVCQTPVADFSGTPTVGVAPLLVQFTDHSTGGATSWSWDFGDGGTSTSQSPSHVYNALGIYAVSLTVRNACGVNTTTKAAYVTVVDACPNPIYSIARAYWTNIVDTNGDGYRTSGRLYWDANVTLTCTKSVFAKTFYRASGDTTWIPAGQSVCYTINGTNSFDVQYNIISGLPRNCYDFRIVLFECSGATEQAVRGPGDDVDLTNQCFEP
ncbi:MAG TPA: PKD domain-containing protein [Candidatus Eisenbacteria bacterium]|nr:PKD domain-containing protein [Candidatus Eisenbacteria bacterium]